MLSWEMLDSFRVMNNSVLIMLLVEISRSTRVSNLQKAIHHACIPFNAIPHYIPIIIKFSLNLRKINNQTPQTQDVKTSLRSFSQ